MPVSLALIIGIVVAVIATVCSYIFIIPEEKRENLPGFLQFVHDLFNFRAMLIESIARVLYIFCTFGSIAAGFLLLFGSTFWVGLIVMIIGPLVLRMVYELIMLFVLMVQNTISLNRKIK